jgi:hypothetical protein
LAGRAAIFCVCDVKRKLAAVTRLFVEMGFLLHRAENLCHTPACQSVDNKKPLTHCQRLFLSAVPTGSAAYAIALIAAFKRDIFREIVLRW